MIALALSLPVRPVGAEGTGLAREVRVYVYQPQLFADLPLGVGLPANTDVLQSYLWYLRMDDSIRALAGMESLAHFVRDRGILGIDFTGHRTLTNGDLETFFRPDLWLSGPSGPASKFKLLKLQGTQTDDRSLATLARLFDLQVLVLSEQVTDKGVQFLRSLKQLRSLAIPAASVTDASMDVVAALPRLRRLSLQGTQVTNAGLQKLRGLSLRQLDVGHAITHTGLQQLSGMRMLESLDLHESRVTAPGLLALAHLPGLHTLFLGPSITDADATALVHFKNLKRLDLTRAQITDASLPALVQMTQLEELALTHTGVTAQALETLRRLPNLRYLEVSGTRVSPTAFKNISGFPALQVLSFSSERRLTPADVKPLGRLTRLHTILINGWPLGRDLVGYRQQQAQGARSLRWQGLIPAAYAAPVSDADIDKALQVASGPGRGSRVPIHGFSGLKVIHEAEASLDEVIPAPSTINQDDPQDTEKNFLGEFVIEAGTVKRKK